MADKSIDELVEATTITRFDNFVLEQDGTAKKLSGDTLIECLGVELDAHGGIRKIEKTGTSVLTDTYTITYSDNTTTTFTVTNGKGITSITGPTTSVLTDTYTINYNDRSTQTYNVKNGRGIASITGPTQPATLTDRYTINYNDNSTAKTFDVKQGKGITEITGPSTSVLTDTYTIKYNDNTNTTYTVKNGRGISSITGPTQPTTLTDRYTINYNDNSTAKTFDVKQGRGITEITGPTTSGLNDTYTIKYNDNTTSTYVVKNGAKGDKGDKGNKGDNITVSSIQYHYADGGTSSSTPPSSGWQANTPPTVLPGNYLWTRVTVTYSDNTTCTSYSVAYQGKNGTGTGTVQKVNNISPTSDGNVTITAANISGTVQKVNNVSPSSDGSVSINATNIALSGSDSTTVSTAISNVNTAVGKVETLIITVTGIVKTNNSVFTEHVTDSNIESDMVCINSVFSNPTAQGSDWSVSTSNGSLDISGTFKGSSATDLTLYLMKSR